MRMLAFAHRNLLETLRDKLNLFFGVLFPLLILLLLHLIGSNVPPEAGAAFALPLLTPGIAVFGLSFVALFSGMLIAKDRASMFMTRLFATPMTSADFILGYTLPAVPLALLQGLCCYLCALLFGMKFSCGILVSLLLELPAALLFIGIGLLCGTFFTDRQVGGICGALLTNLSAWLSGIWFDLSLLGKTVQKIAEALPFANAVTAVRAAVAGDYAAALRPTLIVLAYALITLLIAVLCFRRKMKAGA